jgi:hypothetical protein
MVTEAETNRVCPVQRNDKNRATRGAKCGLKYWYEHWGAEVVAATAGDLELQVQHPPTTSTTALELAKEQYMYCRDLVEQHTGSVGVLARLLLDSPVWWFWWD